MAGQARKRNFSIRAAKSQLLRALMSARKNELAMYRDLRDVGLAWIDICAWCDDPDEHDGKRISAWTWAKENAPIDKKWLDEHAKFARRWNEFLATWRWAQEAGYSPERRPGLRTAFDLMDTKRRADTYNIRSDRRMARTPVRVDATSEQSRLAAERTVISPACDLLVGDVVDMMSRHVADESIDLITADCPWFLRIPEAHTTSDQLYNLHGMRGRFREDWDRFPTIAAYEEFSEAWITEAMRCLKSDGSLFVFGSFQNIPLIGRLLQVMDINVVQNIQVVKLNGRPLINQQSLQPSHYTLIWATKCAGGYRFNEHQTKQAAYPGDEFNNKRGVRMRDVWCIPNIHSSGAHPAAKGTEVFRRIMDVAGLPGGRLLDLFAGHGPAALAALRWGMRSTSIERDETYAAEIVRTVQAEFSKRSANRASNHSSISSRSAGSALQATPAAAQ